MGEEMEVIISNQITIREPTLEVELWCRNRLRIRNPEYIKKKRMGFWTGNIPEQLVLFQRNGEDIILPYGCVYSITEMIGGEDTLTTNFKSPREVSFGCDIPLYDYQEKAVNETQFWYCGIIQSPAGSGKTQMGLALAARLGRKTLWLTHTKDLLLQSKQRAEQYMDPSLLGTITEGRVNIGKAITFATVQTMASLNLPLLRDEWDVIIVDECHHVAGTPTAVTQFSKVLDNLAARHKYGLSATVHRADGLIQATYAILGNIIYEVPEEAVAGKIRKVAVLAKGTGTGITPECLHFDGTVIYAKLIDHLTSDRRRNEIIRRDILDEYGDGHSCLVLSERLDHLSSLMASLPPEARREAVMVSGKMSTKKGKAEREQAIEDMRAGRKKILFATYALAKEGLDIPRLDRLFLATPQKDFAVITQSIGRIARDFPSKEEPVCFDYVDNIQSMAKSFKRRCTIYRKAGCRFIEGVRE